MANYGITIGDYVYNPKNGVKAVLRNTMVYCKGFRSLESLEQYVLDWGPYDRWGYETMPAERTDSASEVQYVSTMDARRGGLGCDNRAVLKYVFKMLLYDDRHLDDTWMLIKQGRTDVPTNTFILENPNPNEY